MPLLQGLALMLAITMMAVALVVIMAVIEVVVARFRRPTARRCFDYFVLFVATRGLWTGGSDTAWLEPCRLVVDLGDSLAARDRGWFRSLGLGVKVLLWWFGFKSALIYWRFFEAVVQTGFDVCCDRDVGGPGGSGGALVAVPIDT